jgi:hypothetical protein
MEEVIILGKEEVISRTIGKMAVTEEDSCGNHFPVTLYDVILSNQAVVIWKSIFNPSFQVTQD